MDIVLTSALVILIVGCVVGYSVRAKTASDRVPAIQPRAPSCANGEPDRGTLLEAHHRLLERRHGVTRRPFAAPLLW